MPQADRFRHPGKLRDELIVNRLLHEQPRAGGADFALAEKYAHEDPFERRLEVRIRKNDVGGLAAEFERELFQISG
jgi:hypothetical protein